MKSWYLIQTKPRQEHTARHNLEKQGFSVYLPMAYIRRRRHGKSYTGPGPMFPRYLFIHLGSGTDDWGPIRSTIGVAKLVRFGQLPARVPDRLISVLKDREDERGILAMPDRTFQPGDRVRIAEGPFEGYEAVIHAKTAKERTILLLKVLETHVKLELETGHLEALTD
jgi:transcriptional antiterminator RfaH